MNDGMKLRKHLKLTTTSLMQIGKSTVNSTIKTNDFYKIGYNDELLGKSSLC